MSLKDLMKNELPDEKLRLLPKGYEVIGDIAIINLPQQLHNEKYEIARALAIHRKDVSVVLLKKNMISGEKRVAGFETLIGDRTATIHRENGCLFHVDVARTYFSGKMYFERNRIVERTHDGEDVLVLFCGVGAFLFPIRKKKYVRIIGLDNNPDAASLFRKNAELNNIDSDIILGDANRMDSIFRKKFDRIVMPAPYGQDHFLNKARRLLRTGGIIHYYTFKKDFEISHFRRLLEEMGWYIEYFRNCGDVASRVSRYVFDIREQ